MSIEDLVKTVKKLRSPGGCPWDREQTHSTLFPYLIEETYETIDAYENNRKDFCGELGDLLLQVVLHCQIGSENKEFDLEKVAYEVNQKMIRRHPHVFLGKKADTSQDSLALWEEMKKKEKKKASKNLSTLSGIPNTLPALLKAYRIGEKAAAVGFDWEQTTDVVAKVKEEICEFEEATEQADISKIEEEFGDLMFSLVHLARHIGLNAETTLNKANTKFTKRFNWMEEQCQTKEIKMSTLTLDELEQLWEEAKKFEKK